MFINIISIGPRLTSMVQSIKSTKQSVLLKIILMALYQNKRDLLNYQECQDAIRSKVPFAKINKILTNAALKYIIFPPWVRGLEAYNFRRWAYVLRGWIVLKKLCQSMTATSRSQWNDWIRTLFPLKSKQIEKISLNRQLTSKITEMKAMRCLSLIKQ